MPWKPGTVRHPLAGALAINLGKHAPVLEPVHSHITRPRLRTARASDLATFHGKLRGIILVRLRVRDRFPPRTRSRHYGHHDKGRSTPVMGCRPASLLASWHSWAEVLHPIPGLLPVSHGDSQIWKLALSTKGIWGRRGRTPQHRRTTSLVADDARGLKCRNPQNF